MTASTAPLSAIRAVVSFRRQDVGARHGRGVRARVLFERAVRQAAPRGGLVARGRSAGAHGRRGARSVARALLGDPAPARRSCAGTGDCSSGSGSCRSLGCQLFFFSAMQRMPVAVALLIQYLAPVLLVAFAWVRTRRAPSALVLLGLGGGDRRTRARRRHLGCVVRPDRDPAGSWRRGVRRARTSSSRSAPATICRRSPSLRAVCSSARPSWRSSCATGILPFQAPAIDVVLAGVEVPWFVPLLWVAAIAHDARLCARRHGRAAHRLARRVVRRAFRGALRARVRVAVPRRGACADPVRRRRAHPRRRRARAPGLPSRPGVLRARSLRLPPCQFHEWRHTVTDDLAHHE